jgi:hypothetical protein
VHTLVWLRMPGDTVFAVGALLLVVFIAGLWLFPRREGELRGTEPSDDSRAASPGRER